MRIRPFTPDDLLAFNAVNLDRYTETYNLGFYLNYLARWPECCLAVEGAGGCVAGYVLGKVEGKGREWHGHVTALAVAPSHRRRGLAAALMAALEKVSAEAHDAYYVDLFVRASNAAAIRMYEKLGYVTYRRVKGYYSGEEDALDMRKSLPRDTFKAAMVPLGRDITPAELEFD